LHAHSRPGVVDFDKTLQNSARHRNFKEHYVHKRILARSLVLCAALISCAAGLSAQEWIKFVVTDANVNVRAEAGISAAVVGKAQNGDLLTGYTYEGEEDIVNGKKNRWYHVRLDQKIDGYVWGEFLAQVVDETAVGGKKVVLYSKGVNPDGIDFDPASVYVMVDKRMAKLNFEGSKLKTLQSAYIMNATNGNPIVVLEYFGTTEDDILYRELFDFDLSAFKLTKIAGRFYEGSAK